MLDLLGFNLGVELGQLAIILIAFPILYGSSANAELLRAFFPIASVAIALFAFGWLIERAFGLEFMPI